MVMRAKFVVCRVSKCLLPSYNTFRPRSTLSAARAPADKVDGRHIFMFWGRKARDGQMSCWLARGEHSSRMDWVDVRTWGRKTCDGKVPWWLVGDEHRTDWVTSYLASAARMNHTAIISQLLCAPAVDASILSFHGRPIGHHAAETGSLDAIKVLVKSGVKIHAKDSCGRNMVHVASQFCQLQMLNYLLNIGVDYYAFDKSGQTPLHLAGEKQPAEVGKYQSPKPDNCSVKVGYERKDGLTASGVTKAIVARLVDAGAEVMVPNMSGQTPIEALLHRGEQEVALALLRSMRKTVQPFLYQIERFKQYGPRILHTAACLDYPEIAEALVEQGVPVDSVNHNGESPLLVAIANGHTDMMKLLVRLGAHVAFVSSTGMSALHMAVTHSTPTVAAMLLKEYGVSTCMRDNKGWTALDMAASKGRADMIQILLEGGAPVEQQSKGLTPLHTAADAGQADCVRLLLIAKATAGHCWNDLGRKTPLFLASLRGFVSVVELLTPKLTKRQINMHDMVTKHTALTAAIAGGHLRTVQALLMAGANPHFRGINGELPLTLAALHRSTSKSTSIVEALLQAGADPNAYSLRGIPILHTACGAVGGDGSMVKLLIEAGAGVNAPSPGDDFVTPLHEAARCNNAPAARILTNMNLCKLNIQASTPSRETPLGMAVEKGCSDAVQVLLEAGADIGAVPRNALGQRHADSLVNLAVAMGHGHVAYLLSEALRSRGKAAQGKRC